MRNPFLLCRLVVFSRRVSAIFATVYFLFVPPVFAWDANVSVGSDSYLTIDGSRTKQALTITYTTNANGVKSVTGSGSVGSFNPQLEDHFAASTARHRAVRGFFTRACMAWRSISVISRTFRHRQTRWE